MEKEVPSQNGCQLNRQIKADNALIRELKEQVKKLAEAVQYALPALAETMENLRRNLLLFCYQLGYICRGREIDIRIVRWSNCVPCTCSSLS